MQLCLDIKKASRKGLDIYEQGWSTPTTSQKCIKKQPEEACRSFGVGKAEHWQREAYTQSYFLAYRQG